MSKLFIIERLTDKWKPLCLHKGNFRDAHIRMRAVSKNVVRRVRRIKTETEADMYIAAGVKVFVTDVKEIEWVNCHKDGETYAV